MRSSAFDWRQAAWQALVFGVLAVLVIVVLHDTSRNLAARGVASGFAFLESPARIPVSNAPIAFETGVNSNGRALLIGGLNTLKVTLAAIVLSSVLGLAVGLGRLSRNSLARGVCTSYIELFRNVPVLLHIFIWYQVVLNLPGPTDALHLFGALLSNRGLYLPSLAWSGWAWPTLEMPQVDGFDITGGLYMSPEYVALLFGIVLYSATFIAETVRSGILAVSKGQWEAADSMGLPRSVVMRRVILPQAVRVSIPPLTSEYLGILKNSSLAVAIGYQEITAIGNSLLFETGQAIEVVSLTMLFYVAVSFTVSAVMNTLNRRLALVER